MAAILLKKINTFSSPYSSNTSEAIQNPQDFDLMKLVQWRMMGI